MGKLDRKVAVITGGSSGIGLATAKHSIKEGAHVVITGRREKEPQEAAASIKPNVTAVLGDVARLEDLDRLYALVKEKHGHIDILFANAGAGTIAPLAIVARTGLKLTFGDPGGSGRTPQALLDWLNDGSGHTWCVWRDEAEGCCGFATVRGAVILPRNQMAKLQLLNSVPERATERSDPSLVDKKAGLFASAPLATTSSTAWWWT